MDIKSREYEEFLTSVVPNERQMRLLDMGYYNFIHFGLNTFTNTEWGSGKTDPSVFTLRDINTDEWVRQLKATGSKGVIITAKHHDGFCLFDSKYTDYNVTKTSYKDGKGDLIKDLSDSCRKLDFKFGIYLSPWDRHEPTYGSDAYNDFYCNQIEELFTKYGEIFCIWFDGACGEGPNGRKQVYDWDRIYKTIWSFQPDCIISNCGPDSRWIGNERGQARLTEWAVVSTKLMVYDNIAAISQQKGGANEMSKRNFDATDNRLGDRDLLVGEKICFYPSEMDISATKVGWFHRKWFEMVFARSPKELAHCYNTSVGNNATLLLNVAPNKKGELPKKFIKNIMKAKDIVEKQFANEVKIKTAQTGTYEYKATFDMQEVSTVVLGEDLSKSQRVEKFEIYADGNKVFEATTIGFKKFCFFKSVTCSSLTIKVKECRLEPHISKIRVFK